MKVSVVVCTYSLDTYDAFTEAVESILEQTYEPIEIVLVIDEPVIESVTCEEAGFGNCVYQLQNPAKRSFDPRVLECSGYRDSTAVRTP